MEVIINVNSIILYVILANIQGNQHRVARIGVLAEIELILCGHFTPKLKVL